MSDEYIQVYKTKLKRLDQFDIYNIIYGLQKEIYDSNKITKNERMAMIRTTQEIMDRISEKEHE